MSRKAYKKLVYIKEKLQALKRINRGEILKKIAADADKTTVGDWRRCRNKIKKFPSVDCVNSLSSHR